MGKMEMFRKALALPEVVQSVELTDLLKDLYTDYLELQDKNNELRQKLDEFSKIDDIKKKAKIQNGFYTIDGLKDVNGNEIPFCLNCLYEYGLQIPMTYGVIERGIEDYYSKEIMTPTTYGISCNKCKTKLLKSNNRSK